MSSAEDAHLVGAARSRAGRSAGSKGGADPGTAMAAAEELLECFVCVISDDESAVKRLAPICSNAPVGA